MNRLQLLLQSWSMMASKCISQHTQLQLPSSSPSSLDLGIQVYRHTHWIMASKCISEFGRSWSASPFPSAALGSLDLRLQVHLWTCLITACQYIAKERWRVYRDTGVTDVDWVNGCIYSADRRVDRHHLISISSYHTMKNKNTLSFPTFHFTHSVRDCVDP